MASGGQLLPPCPPPLIATAEQEWIANGRLQMGGKGQGHAASTLIASKGNDWKPVEVGLNLYLDHRWQHLCVPLQARLDDQFLFGESETHSAVWQGGPSHWPTTLRRRADSRLQSSCRRWGHTRRVITYNSSDGSPADGSLHLLWDCVEARRPLF